ncbi:accessory gene regulator ArgB-like protein [Aneurinibacillus terranovensis]|uniref:accessory gene regulator ArgB-like protein n=1 Tax=Aneurinibacillus terranovensis TaxID=278991 RepID=UPI0003FE59B9|nr:accessory gene regulator B family protein [Aneurinibacillus terranovensis]
MSKRVADSIAATLVEEGTTPHSAAVLSYGLQIIMNTLIKVTLVTVVGWALHILLYLYIMILAFGTLRMITGGVHAHTFVRCATISQVSFTALSLSIPYTLPFFASHHLLFTIAVVIFGSVVTARYVPGKWEGRNFTAKRIKVSKNLSYFFLLIILAAGYVINAYHYIYVYDIVWAAMLGITWQYILVTPAGYKLFTIIENVLTLKRR